MASFGHADLKNCWFPNLYTIHKPNYTLRFQNRLIEQVISKFKNLKHILGRVPATFAYCNKEILLSEVVNTKNNYKNVSAWFIFELLTYSGESVCWTGKTLGAYNTVS
jgi:hypothetical protein